MRQKAIWGAGAGGTRFFLGRENDDIDFFIDNDEKKCGVHFGKKVLHPSKIKDWNDVFIYIPLNHSKSIAGQLISLGLNKGVDFAVYDDSVISPSKRAVDLIEKNLNACISELKTNKWIGKTIYIGAVSYIDLLIKNGLDIKYVSCYWWNDSSNTLKLPYIHIEGNVPVGFCSTKAKWNYDEKPYIKDVKMQLMDKHEDWGDDECYYFINSAVTYVNALLDELKPKNIIALGSIGPFWVLLNHLCIEKGVPIVFSHWGCIPGTFPFDTAGEMGESLPAVYSESFKKLPVSEGDLDNAEKVWKYLYQTRANRKIQPNNNAIRGIKDRCKSTKPVIFFAGSNDVHSHMIPYNDITKKWHSPIFKSSLEAVRYLETLCEKNDWILIYKPHPMYAFKDKGMMFSTNTVYVDSVDINDLIDFSDVTVTILSTTNYNALVRHKPVVMLGYNQTRGKGCTYEAFEKDAIESIIREALTKGFTDKQKGAFRKHLAQCLKYYLYDDMSEEHIRYGRPLPKNFDEFYELEKMLKNQRS